MESICIPDAGPEGIPMALEMRLLAPPEEQIAEINKTDGPLIGKRTRVA